MQYKFSNRKMEIVGNDLLTYVVEICVDTLLHMVYYITLVNRKDLFWIVMSTMPRTSAVKVSIRCVDTNKG